jgi:RAB protein geranylgeranyltransferase component A
VEFQGCLGQWPVKNFVHIFVGQSPHPVSVFGTAARSKMFSRSAAIVGVLGVFLLKLDQNPDQIHQTVLKVL